MRNDAKRQGVFAVSRKLFDPEDPFFGGEPYTRREAWQWLIAEASFTSERSVRVSTGLGWTDIVLTRGQLSHSRSYMAKAWDWTDKRVRTFLMQCERDGRITRNRGQAFPENGPQKGQASVQHKGQHCVVITICKYEEYQFSIADKGQPRGQPKGMQKGQASPEKGPQEEECLSKNVNNGISAAPKKRQRVALEDAPPDGSLDLDALKTKFLAYAATKGIRGSLAKDEFDGFLSHHRARGNRFADWYCAGQGWVRNSIKFSANRNGRTPGQRPVI